MPEHSERTPASNIIVQSLDIATRRFLDILISACGILVISPLFLIIFVTGLIDNGSPIFTQLRIGRNKVPFKIFKFRTMQLETPHVATHLVSSAYVTPFGRFLRRTKLDELPQLWNVLKGEMSLVGPRPGLLTQVELIRTREMLQIFDARPGITGLAQVSGVDMSDPTRLTELDAMMLRHLTVTAYVRYVVWTVFGRGAGDRVRVE